MDNGERIRLLVDRYERPLCQYASRILGDPGRARDVVQDTFLRFCRKGARLDDASIAPWLYRVCRNRALDIVRKEKPMTALTTENAARIASDEPDPAEAVSKQEAASHLLAALATLPGNQEEALRLKFQQDMTYREIAQVMNITESNVGWLIHSGIRTLRSRLATI